MGETEWDYHVVVTWECQLQQLLVLQNSLFSQYNLKLPVVWLQLDKSGEHTQKSDVRKGHKYMHVQYILFSPFHTVLICRLCRQ